MTDYQLSSQKFQSLPPRPHKPKKSTTMKIILFVLIIWTLISSSYHNVGRKIITDNPKVNMQKVKNFDLIMPPPKALGVATIIATIIVLL